MNNHLVVSLITISILLLEEYYFNTSVLNRTTNESSTVQRTFSNIIIKLTYVLHLIICMNKLLIKLV